MSLNQWPFLNHVYDSAGKGGEKKNFRKVLSSIEKEKAPFLFTGRKKDQWSEKDWRESLVVATLNTLDPPFYPLKRTYGVKSKPRAEKLYPQGWPTVMSGSDHYFRNLVSVRASFHTSVPTFQNFAKQIKF